MRLLGNIVLKECREDVFAVRGMGIYLTAALVLSAFGLLLVGNTELSLLDNAQTVYIMAGIILSLAGLIAVVRGSDAFAGERDRETLEALLISPVSSEDIAFGKLAALMVSWLLLYLLAVPYIWAVGSSGQNLTAALLYLFISGTILMTIFGSLVLSLSARVRSFKGAMSTGLILFLFAAAPVALGPSLRQSFIGHILDWLNPFAIAMNMLDAVIIDSQTTLGQQFLPLAILSGYMIIAVWILWKSSRRITL